MNNDYVNVRRQAAAKSQALAHTTGNAVTSGQHAPRRVGFSLAVPTLAFVTGIALGGLLSAAVIRVARI